MRIRTACVAAAALAIWLLSASAARAQDPVEKLGRGLANVAMGWIEVPKQTAQGRFEDNPFIGVGTGFLRGVAMTVLRFGVGAYETLTFPLPYPNRYASPYAGMEIPDLAWE